jgi:signal transduction histidine kinase
MKVASIPEDEKDRLAALKKYQILDTLPEMDFDDFTKLASHICGTPIALISLVDESRQWFKSAVGLDATETPKNIAFCSHAILQDDVFVVTDSFKDDRFHDNPLAVNAPYVRSYAGAPLNTPSGHKIGTLCVIDNGPRDFNEQQKEALKALARQVVNQMELRLAIKDAQSSSKSKALFLATMSHEIRTPLNGILGCANLLVDNIEEPKNKELAQTITDCGDALLTIVNDILDFTKLESGKMKIENESFDLRQSVEKTIQLFKIQAHSKSINLNLNFHENIPKYVYSDVTRIRQVLSNLLSNAIKFTKSGNIEISINTIKESHESYQVLFSVQDDGIGINEEDESKLFTSFSQVDASTTRRFGGTGLGIAICKEIVQLMGGKIWFKSAPQKGSIFSFTTNFKKSVSGVKPNILPINKIQKDMASRHPLRILLAEDQRINQLVAKKTLRKMGYEVDIASNGLEVLQMLRLKIYDVVLMDCKRLSNYRLSNVRPI